MGKEEYRPHDVRRLVDWEVRPWEVRLHETGRLMLNAHLPTGSRQLAISPTAD